MVYPKFIKQGDTIGVPAPSDGAYCEEYVNRYKNAKLNLEKRGYKVQLSKNIFHSEKGRSSDAISRAKEMNEMFENNADAIICAAGGEFLVEILPYIDFNKLVQNPKWVEGFSDPTGILFPITTKYDIHNSKYKLSLQVLCIHREHIIHYVIHKSKVLFILFFMCDI